MVILHRGYYLMLIHTNTERKQQFEKHKFVCDVSETAATDTTCRWN